MKAIEATGVCRKYERQEVLKNFGLSVEAGEFVALMGPSGSGKSTFLHLAAGLLAADAGTIAVGGTDVTALGDRAATIFRRRHVGVIFQAFNLLDDRSVEENILLPLRLDGRKIDASVRERLASLAGRLGLTPMLAKRPSTLSGGEQQRVAIARAVLVGPEIVLADEPTGNLDVAAAKEICRLLGELNRDEKRTILVVTHDPVVAACASRVCFLKDGKIAAAYATEGDAARISKLYVETYA